MPIVDVHTHVYLPRYMEMLRARSTEPFVFRTDQKKERLVILPGEHASSATQAGRPIGYKSFITKLDQSTTTLTKNSFSWIITQSTFLYSLLQTLGWTFFPKPNPKNWLPNSTLILMKFA